MKPLPSVLDVPTDSSYPVPHVSLVTFLQTPVVTNVTLLPVLIVLPEKVLPLMVPVTLVLIPLTVKPVTVLLVPVPNVKQLFQELQTKVSSLKPVLVMSVSPDVLPVPMLPKELLVIPVLLITPNTLITPV